MPFFIKASGDSIETQPARAPHDDIASPEGSTYVRPPLAPHRSSLLDVLDPLDESPTGSTTAKSKVPISIPTNTLLHAARSGKKRVIRFPTYPPVVLDIMQGAKPPLPG